MSKVLITGAAGFLGRHLAAHFQTHGWAVYATDTKRPDTPTRPVSEPDPTIREILRTEQPDVCIHCAGKASIAASLENPAPDFTSGPALTFHLLDTIRREHPACRFIFISSAAVYGNPQVLPVVESCPAAPISPYGFHKWQSEIICEEFRRIYRISSTSVRIFSAYGNGLQRQILWDACRKIHATGTLALRGTGHESRDFIHVDDIARALELLAQQTDFAHATYNLASGSATTIADLAALITATFDREIPTTFDGIVDPGAPLNWQAKMSRFRALDFAPKMKLEDGIRAYCAWAANILKGAR